MQRASPRLPLAVREDGPLAYGLAVLLTVTAVLLRLSLDAELRNVQFITFFPAVVISAFFLGRRAGILTAVLCGAAGWYLFLPPRFSFAVENPSTAIALAFYFCVSLVLALVIGTMRTAVRREREATAAVRESEERLRNVLEQMPVGVILARKPSGKLIVANRKSEELLGHPAAAGSASEYGRFGGLHPDGRTYGAEEYPTARAVLHGERTEDEEMRYLRPDGRITHLSVSAKPVVGSDGEPDIVVCTFFSIDERKRFEDHQQLLINELNHRVKNTLAIVQSIAQQTFAGSTVPDDRRHAFEGRLAALSAAHNVLNLQKWEAAPIREIIGNSISAYSEPEGVIHLDGPDLLLPPKAAVAVAIAIHELATNAAKYGALSTPGGSVDVRWRREDGRLRLTWQESGGPPVTPPARRGFGSRMIERALSAELEGDVKLAFEPGGVVCTIDAPLPDPG
ncbi:MAG TPA: HWE histidine kinase domain-containing protein [Allosphingosinicella sp.]